MISSFGGASSDSGSSRGEDVGGEGDSGMTGVPPRFHRPSPLPNIINTGRSPGPPHPSTIPACRALSRIPQSLNCHNLPSIVAIFPQLSRVFPQSCHAFPHVAHFADCAWSLVRSSSPCDCIPLSSQSFPLSPSYI